MCVHVRFTARSGAPIYDSGAGTITLPAALKGAHSATALRAVLSELRVEQPEFGAVCWCGEPIMLFPRVPQQRESEQVIKHGA